MSCVVFHDRLFCFGRWRCQSRVRRLLPLILFFNLATLARAGDDVIAKRTTQPEMPETYVSPTNGLGSWIWEKQTLDDQTCQLWKAFEIPQPGGVTNAQLVLTVDNEFTLYLDGQELGRGSEWRELFVFDVTRLMSPGRHILAVRCYNGSFFAGMILGLQANLTNGRTLEVKSDDTWRVVPNGLKRWEKAKEPQAGWAAATVIAPLGSKPWWTQPEYVNRMPPPQSSEIHFWQTGWFQITMLGSGGVIVLIVFRLMAQLAFHQNERRLLQRERARIASEIHDDIGSRMTQLVLDGEEMQGELSVDSGLRARMNRLCDDVRGLLSTMDEILWAVNPRRDTLLDFATYISKYTQKFLKPTRIQCLLELDPEISTTEFDLPLRRSLFLAIKESLNNAVKHSAARELLLKMQWQNQTLVVIVQDNGRGFDLSTPELERNGLTNMAQRMIEIGGRCLVTSQPGKGFRVEFSIPVKPRHPWPWIWNTGRFSEPMNELGKPRGNGLSTSHEPTKS
jgi:signal transduction histidine kinase